jgi:sensor histidine kinase YesM
MNVQQQRDNVGLPSFWQLQTLGWMAFYIVLILAVLPYRKTAEFRNQTIAWAVMSLASFALRPICRSLVRSRLSWISLEFRAVAWSGAAGTVAAFVTEWAILRAIRLVWVDLLVNALQFSVVLFLWCTLYFGIKQWQEAMLQRERLLSAESEARDARLRALRYQLNPHFLFNSLNAVSTLVLKGDAASATRMLSQIAALLRVSLDGPVASEMPLSQELSFARKYLAIEQTRLGERLETTFNLAPESLDAAVPSMLLQPLLENAVRHGIGRLRQGGVIDIHTSVEGDRLRLIVRNSGDRNNFEDTHATAGIGLTNTRERLQRLYGFDYNFDLRWPDHGVCEVVIELPYKKLLELQEHPCVQ